MTIHENDFGIEYISMTKEQFKINRLTYTMNDIPFIDMDSRAIEIRFI